MIQLEVTPTERTHDGRAGSILVLTSDPVAGWDIRSSPIAGLRVAGYLDYEIISGKVYVAMIEVAPGWKRKGVATKMYRELERLYPNKKILTPDMTAEGLLFFQAVQHRQHFPEWKVRRSKKRSRSTNTSIGRMS